MSSEYSGDELKDNKKEFLTSRLFIDEHQLDLRTEEKTPAESQLPNSQPRTNSQKFTSIQNYADGKNALITE